MIIGAHSIVYSRDPDRDRAFLRDVLGLSGVDIGGGWLVFGLPPAEVAVHPGEKNDVHELYLIADDIGALVARLTKQGVECSPPRVMSWGTLTQVKLPGGGSIGVYEARHARPNPPAQGPKQRKAPRRRSAVGGAGGRRTRR